jgi:fatty acid-binding protein DegV
LKLGDVEQIDKYMQEAPKKNVIAIILNETKYLVRGGRLSALKGMVASLLKFKIVLYLNKDGVALYDKTFKPSSVISIVKKLFKETIGADVTNIDSSYIFSSGISSSAKLSNHAMIEELEKNFKIKANIKKLPCVIAAHVGPNYCALSVKIK